MGLLKLRLGIPQSSSESLIVSFDIPVVKVSSRSLTSDDSDIGLERCDRWPLPPGSTRSLTPSVAVIDPGAGDSLALNLNKSRSSPWTTARIRRRWIIDSREMRGGAVAIFIAIRATNTFANASPRLARYLGAWNRILINSKAAEQKLRGSDWSVNAYSFRRVYWNTKTSYSYAIQRLLRTNRLFDCVSQSVCSQHWTMRFFATAK